MSGCATKIAFLLGTVFLLLESGCSALADPDVTEWWENTLIYEISPSAYQDSDGDGRGDLQGFKLTLNIYPTQLQKITIVVIIIYRQ